MDRKRINNIVRTSQMISLMAMSGMVISPALSGIGAYFSHISPVLVQMLVTVPSICMLPSTLISAKVKEHLSYRQIFLVCLMAILVGGIAPVIIKNFWVMMVCRVLIGLAIGLLTPVNTAMLTSCLPPDERTRALGLNSAMESIGGAAMVIVCGWLAAVSWELCFVVYLITLLPVGMVFFRFKENYVSEVTGSKNKVIFRKPIVLLTLIMCVYMTFLNIFSTNISGLILEKKVGSTVLSGIVVAIYLLSGFFCGLVFDKLSRSFGRFTFAMGILLCAVGILMIGLAGSSVLIIVGSLISGFGMGLAIPAGLNLVSEMANAEEQTFSISLLLSGSRVGQFLTTLIYVPILSVFSTGITGAYIISAVAMAIIAGVSCFINK